MREINVDGDQLEDEMRPPALRPFAAIRISTVEADLSHVPPSEQGGPQTGLSQVRSRVQMLEGRVGMSPRLLACRTQRWCRNTSRCV